MLCERRLSRPSSGLIALFLLGFCFSLPVGTLAAEPAPPSGQAEIFDPLDVMPADVTKSPTVITGGEAGGVLGREVRSAADEKLGRIVDVIVDRSGATRAAIIDFGGFLGVGSRKIAVAWDLLAFAAPSDGEDRITVRTTRNRLNTAPEFKDGKPITVLSARDDAASRKVTTRALEQ